MSPCIGTAAYNRPVHITKGRLLDYALYSKWVPLFFSVAKQSDLRRPIVGRGAFSRYREQKSSASQHLLDNSASPSVPGGMGYD